MKIKYIITLLYLNLNIFLTKKIYKFNYEFRGNLRNRMMIGYNNIKFRESVIVGNQEGEFYLESNKINNFSYYFIENNINEYNFKKKKIKVNEIYNSNRIYKNIIFNRDNKLIDIIRYNNSKIHYMKIIFSFNFFSNNKDSKINQKLRINIYNNNKILLDKIIYKNYFSFYKEILNKIKYNNIYIYIQKLNNLSSFICLSCKDGYYNSYNFQIITRNYEENKDNKINNNNMININNFHYENKILY